MEVTQGRDLQQVPHARDEVIGRGYVKKSLNLAMTAPVSPSVATMDKRCGSPFGSEGPSLSTIELITEAGTVKLLRNSFDV
ncbi:hypothetical protein, partial [Marinobacter salsuginis]|uniref:Uncharacterized protein n=1 Tax=Marinobacter salsuginis TaxID=418719 RepID=A0A5M3Q0P5_9GAMM